MISQELTTILRHQGIINGPIISELLDDLDDKCINLDVVDNKRRKIFNLAVEMFQNLYHYTRDFSIEGYDDSYLRTIFLTFDISPDFYFLTTSNFINNNHVEKIKMKIEKVNNLNKAELREYYKDVLTNDQFSDKGGAGLGFIDMKKKSGLPLEYIIEKVDNKLSKYTLNIKVEK